MEVFKLFLGEQLSTVEMRVGKALQVARTARAKVRWNLTRRSYFHRYNTPLLRNPQSGIYWPLRTAPGREGAARWSGNR